MISINFTRLTQDALDVFDTVVEECQITDCTSTNITGSTSTGDEVVFSGTFTLEFNAETGKNEPVGGTVTDITITCGGVLFMSLTDMDGDYAELARDYNNDNLAGWFAGEFSGGVKYSAGDGDDDMIELRDILIGNDCIDTEGGNDQAYGGLGNDIIVGGDGNDVVFGNEGNDILIGGVSPDLSNTAGAQVYRIYQATLDRAPDTGGFENWVNVLESGSNNLQGVVSGFVGSAEFQNTYGSLNNTDFVTLLYNNVLDRTPDEGGLNGWLDAMTNGTSRAQVVTGFSESGEFRANTSFEASAYTQALDGRAESGFYDDVYRLYQATLDRAPDAAGLEGWSDQLADGRGYTDVAAGFTNSGEFRATYGNLDDGAFINQLYRNVLDREADAGGRQGWLNVINNGGTREDVVRGFAQSGEFVSKTADPFEAYMKAGGGDTLDGGSGNDTLYSGTTADTFVFDASEDGSDIVLQLDTWDALQFEGFGYSSATDARAQMLVAGPDVRFADQGVTITFAGADLATMQEVDYLFG